MSKSKHRIVLLVGPSGSGKTAIANYLHDTYGWNTVQSYTTRPPRYDGEEGHTFVTDEEFDKLTDMIAYTEFDGHRYCATSGQIDQCDVYVVDPQGVRTMQTLYHGASRLMPVYVDVKPRVCMARMLDRGDSLARTLQRLGNDKKEFAGAKEYLSQNFDSVLTIYNNKEIAAAGDIVHRWATI